MFPDFTDPQVLRASLVKLVALVLAITVHEYSHALAAFKLGDDYAARQGRLTLNPLVHADPLGTVLLPLFIGFGWGRPVPYIPQNLTRKYTLRAGEAIIAFAGPLSNLLMGIVCAGLWVGLTKFGVLESGSPFSHLLWTGLYLNFVLFFFNLLPIPPLDGSKVAAWLFGPKADPVLDRIQGAGMLGLMVAVVFGGFLISPFVGVSVEWVLMAFRAVM